MRKTVAIVAVLLSTTLTAAAQQARRRTLGVEFARAPGRHLPFRVPDRHAVLTLPNLHPGSLKVEGKDELSGEEKSLA